MKKKKKLSLLAREQRLAYKLLFPTFLVLLIIAAYPLTQVFVTSFTNKGFAVTRKTKFVGLSNYSRLLSIKVRTFNPEIENSLDVLPKKPFRFKELSKFKILNKHYVVGASDPDFIRSVSNTILFAFFSVLLETVLGLIVALVVNSNFRGKGVMRATMLVPWAVITVVSARMWDWMLQPNRIGMFNSLFARLGFSDGQVSFLTSEAWQLPSIIAVDVWKTTPFMALLLLAGLQVIPKTLYEAAEVDGAGKIRQFFQITLPLLKPSLAVALIFRTLDALRVFDLFQVMLSTRKYSMASYNYAQLINYRNMGMASSIGMIIFVIIFAFALGYMKFLGVDTDAD